jgi:DMSO/TMAO reductase YedYZ molybdopterin-dependent catalytic subunit
LKWETVDADFHCVTQWSALNQTWEGVAFSQVLSLAQPDASARFVMVHCYGGYTTNLPLDLALEEGLFAHKHMGEPLGMSHGWPLRLVVPSRYGWKSAKWVNGIELIADDAPGFWELRGYHNDGDPWKEERFWPELMQ